MVLRKSLDQYVSSYWRWRKSVIRLVNNEGLKTLTKTLKFVDTDASADAGGSTIAIQERCSGELKIQELSLTHRSGELLSAQADLNALVAHHFVDFSCGKDPRLRGYDIRLKLVVLIHRRYFNLKKKVLFIFLFRLNVAFNNLSVIWRLFSGCDRELNAHFKSAASLTYHTSDTWLDIPPSHIILTLDRPVSLSQCRAQIKEQLIPFWTFLVWLDRGSNQPPSGRKPDTLVNEPLCQ